MSISHAATLSVDTAYAGPFGSTCEQNFIQCFFGTCFSQVQDAVNAASPGDTIRICPGVYTESVQIISKGSLSFESTTSNAVDVEITSGSSNAFYLNNSVDVSFNALTLRGKQNAIQFFSSPGAFKIENSILFSTNDHTVFVGATPSNFIIQNNQFIGAGDGFKSAVQFQAGADNGLIEGNNIASDNNNGYGIYVFSTPANLTVTNNCFQEIGSEEAFSFSTGASPLAWDGNYWQKQSWYGVIDNAPLATCSLGGIATEPIADYRFDSCAWDGTALEVLDTSGNDYHGSSVGSDTNQDAQLCRSGDFSADGTGDYVVLDSNALDGFNDFSISVWLKTVNTGTQAVVSGARSAQANEALMWFTSSTRFRPYVKGSARNIDITDIADNTWHHFVWTRSGVENCAYLDGVLQGCRNINGSAGAVQIDTGGLILAQEQDSVGGSFSSSQDFEGLIDELKIYDSTLDLSAVQSIYNNENAQNNYDGTTRTCNTCSVCGTYSGSLNSIQFVGDQITLLNTYQTPEMTKVTYKDNYIFSENPVIFVLPNTQGGNPADMRVKNVDSRGFEIAIVEPQGEDGAHISMDVDYFAVNVGDTGANSASQVYQLGGQIIEVGYIKTTKVQKGYDIATNEWETITPKGNFCNPVVVTQIQGMVNEPSYDPSSPSEPFLTVATEISGTDIKLALERSETNVGTIAQPEMIAYMISEANVQASFIDDVGNTVLFETIQTGKIFYGWDDSAVSTNFVNTYGATPLVAAGLNSRDSLDGGWFRKKTHTNSLISLVIDEDRLRGSSGPGSVQDTERSKKRNTADGNPNTPESAGIFVFDGTFILTGEVKKGTLNAVNIAEKDIFDGNISTQIVGSVLDLALVAREDDNVTKRDADIVKLEIINCADVLCLDCAITNDATTIFDNAAAPIQIAASVGYKLLSEAGVTYTMPLAKKVQKLRITEAGESPTCSFDTFAIRPDTYELSSTSPVYAGENFLLNFKALDASGANTLGYNESDSNNSFIINYVETRPECNAGETLNRGVVAFVDGASLNVDANYTGLANFLNISIAENNGSEFAFIDADDTPDAQRFITADDINISVLPYELNITSTQISASTGLSWLYMADVNDMNVSTYVSVQANNKNHDILQDFNASCYAQDVDINFGLIVSDGSDTVDMNYASTQGSFLSTGTTLGDINQSLRIAAAEFSLGVGEAAYAFNVNRAFSNPLSPFNVRGLSAQIASTGVSKVVNSDTTLADGNFTFYYGRLYVDDIVTTSVPVSNSVSFEVYNELNTVYTQGMQQNGLFWYLNSGHISSNEGVVTQAVASSNTLIDNALGGYSFNYNPISSGEQGIDITAASTSKATIHLKTQKWLWYAPFGFGSSYADGGGSDCSMHPCFKFSIVPNNTALKVESGDFNGTIVPDENRSDYTQKGVKLFR